jgi:membrane-bound inhibitor of C-type lysozyme
MELINFIVNFSIALATPCQVYPSEYAYRDDTVTRAESIHANCRNYPQRDGDMGITYVHCSGEQLKLSDSDRGSNMEYTATSYYVWTTGSDGPLLFIFPERVSLTTITLHYYSDSIRGLSRLRFYAVSDDFDVRDAPTSGTPYVGIASVPPGGEPAGRRSIDIRINDNFNNRRVLMYKFSSSPKFQFAVSEVSFRCNSKQFSIVLAINSIFWLGCNSFVAILL